MKYCIALYITAFHPFISFSQKADTTAALHRLQRFFHNIPITGSYSTWVNYIEHDDNYKLDSTSRGSVFLKLTDKLFNPFNIRDLQYEYVIERTVMFDTVKRITLDTVDALYMLAIFPDNKVAVSQIKTIVKQFRNDFSPQFKNRKRRSSEHKGHRIIGFSYYLNSAHYTSFISIYYSYSENFKKYYLAIELTRMKDYHLFRDYHDVYAE